ncbi:DUF333 domain-containing protein [Methylobacterium soli]|uniref:DUF333 domain-containing protein n=2 Tax=Methylobacterium soli TaxID=553447 RepID=A0A6L3SPL8_9HYPH|nr:DUF333 domain-containing protein [Methylobacterium soli]KAB1070079.1 DUF333 domain-containing protein [Methylobacterium soli]
MGVVLKYVLTSGSAHAAGYCDYARLALANPAAVNCAEKGGASEVRSGAGGQTGYCRFPDGQICEEWALLRDKRCVPPPPEKKP